MVSRMRNKRKYNKIEPKVQFYLGKMALTYGIKKIHRNSRGFSYNQISYFKKKVLQQKNWGKIGGYRENNAKVLQDEQLLRILGFLRTLCLAIPETSLSTYVFWINFFLEFQYQNLG